MSSLIATSSDLVTYLGISQAAAQRVYASQPRAEKEVREMLTDDVYDGLVEDLPGSDAAALNAKQAAYAEGLLALHHSVATLGIRMADEGGLLTSVGMGEYANELISPFQLGKIEAKFYAKAMEALKDLRPELAIDGTIFVTQEDVDAQYQGNGFGLTAVGSNNDAWTLNHRTGTWE